MKGKIETAERNNTNSQDSQSSPVHEQRLELPQNDAQLSLNLIRTAIKHRRIYFWIGVMLCLVAPSILALILMNHSFTIHQAESVHIVIGGYCTFSACLLSLFQIIEHLLTFAQPEMQCKIIRILLMVPIYSLMSFMSCVSHTAAPYLSLFRDIYEAYALYNFFLLMIALLGGKEKAGRTLEQSDQKSIEHLYPMSRYLRPIITNSSFVKGCDRCLFQFMCVKPFMAFLLVVFVVHAKCTGQVYSFSFRTKSFLWIRLIENVSVTIAFTALLYFYRATKRLLKGHSPLGKFLCIKLVIFVSFWQGILIDLLHACNLLPQSSYWTQNFLITIEMLIVSYGHKFFFGSQNYASRFRSIDQSRKKSPSKAKEKGCPHEESPFFGFAEKNALEQDSDALRYAHRTPLDNLRYTLLHRDFFPQS